MKGRKREDEKNRRGRETERRRERGEENEVVEVEDTKK